MLPALIRRRPRNLDPRSRDRGFTMALVAVAMVAMIGMAALSIDLGTLYQAKAEAQRAADAAALSAARVISFSGITGDPSSSSWAAICGGLASPATLIAVNTAQQNLIAGAAAGTVTVSYSTSSGGANTNCQSLGTDFGVNPIVTVTVQRGNLPIFFAKVFSLFPGVNYSGTGVRATAIAEAYNPSNSGKGAAAVLATVQPRCVKPWIVPNLDPGNGGGALFVVLANGAIYTPGIYQLRPPPGVIGETFNLRPACKPGAVDCLPGADLLANPPVSNTTAPQYADYVPALVSGTPAAAPSCSSGTFQRAIAGCDQNTVYTCGVPSTTAGATQADLTENPVNPGLTTGDTAVAAECLINQTAGQDSLMGTPAPEFPFRIVAGTGNPLIAAGVTSGEVITASNSMVTIPIADFPVAGLVGSQPAVSIVGFLQVFINYVDTTAGPTNGYVNVTVINVSGCGNGATGGPVFGTSPVPVRLITPPS